jgi:hypothetical protein
MYSSITAATASSQGQRSSSVSGTPARILATLAAGCSESPSMKGQSSLLASSWPTVDLPHPETPARSTITAGQNTGRSHWREMRC